MSLVTLLLTYGANNSKSWCKVMFVCVEVLQPSQPTEVMSRADSLPNHTFIGQA